ncbi:hypothetical protein [Vannielia sp.]|uniref:hypothetical protein n=1 Tax=Vannielia sp. TaxID=2813045 RepID=UPI0026198C08|nr:hypothetical protein [Vannielia sp.]MDF1873669.1 hypothetical protein [Vannielia sp.]
MSDVSTDAPETLPYQINLNWHIGADVRHSSASGGTKTAGERPGQMRLTIVASQPFGAASALQSHVVRLRALVVREGRSLLGGAVFLFRFRAVCRNGKQKQ